jgi:hypothetical protein
MSVTKTIQEKWQINEIDSIIIPEDYPSSLTAGMPLSAGL